MEYYAALKKKIHIDEPWGHYAEWNKPVTEGQILHVSNLHELSKIVKLIEAESRMMVARGKGGWEKWGAIVQMV